MAGKLALVLAGGWVSLKVSNVTGVIFDLFHDHRRETSLFFHNLLIKRSSASHAALSTYLSTFSALRTVDSW